MRSLASVPFILLSLCIIALITASILLLALWLRRVLSSFSHAKSRMYEYDAKIGTKWLTKALHGESAPSAVKLHGEKIIKADLESQECIKPVPSAINTLHLSEPAIQPVREVVVDYTPDNVKVGYKESLVLTIIHDCRGGSRWRTLMPHSFGLYKAKIRTPSGNAAGLCSTLYLSTVGEQQDEIDCEFLGKEKGLLQTNFITGGTGGREVQYHLGMDTSADFHEYSILWTPAKISWFLDERCLRVAEREGDEPWPVRSMYLYGSLWNAESVVDGEWAGTYVGCDEPYTCAYKDVFVPAGCDIVQCQPPDYNRM